MAAAYHIPAELRPSFDRRSSDSAPAGEPRSDGLSSRSRRPHPGRARPIPTTPTRPRASEATGRSSESRCFEMGSRSVSSPVYRIRVPFTDRQVELVTTFADQGAIAIENVRLFQELEARNKDLTETLEQQTATGEILRVISARPPTPSRCSTPSPGGPGASARPSSATCRLRCRALHFIAHDGQTEEGLAVARRAFPRPPDRGTAAGRAVLAADVAEIADVHQDPEYALGGVAQAITFRGIVAVPMLRDGQPIGAIAVARLQAGRFPDRQVGVLKPSPTRRSSPSRTSGSSRSSRRGPPISRDPSASSGRSARSARPSAPRSISTPCWRPS